MIERKRLERRPITGAAPVKTPDDEIVERGRLAWQRLRDSRTWPDWMTVGAALAVGRRECMEKTGAKEPRGRTYNKAFNDWLECNGFTIDSGDRGKLLQIMERREEIEAWRDTLPQNQRQKMNHPSTVWRAKFACPRRRLASHKEKRGGKQDDEIAWQEGLMRRAREAAGAAKIEGWLLPYPPDDGLISAVEKVLEAWTKLRDDLRSIAARHRVAA